jgi:cytochrome subunit of sulfide dehydrogenase
MTRTDGLGGNAGAVFLWRADGGRPLPAFAAAAAMRVGRHMLMTAGSFGRRLRRCYSRLRPPAGDITNNEKESIMAPAKVARAAIIIALSAVAAPAIAQGASQGSYLAANCANCHGTAGAAAQGMPSLAGLPRETLIQQMQAFKAGTRPATIMHQLSKGYTDQQIEQIADYLSKQPRK